METLEVWHFSLKLCKFYLGIYFICEEYRLLLVYPSLVGCYTDEEVIAGDMGSSLTYMACLLLLVVAALS